MPKVRKKRRKRCKHPNAFVERYGITGELSVVKCPDCGFSRERNAF